MRGESRAPARARLPRREFRIPFTHDVIEIADGTTYEGWTFGGVRSWRIPAAGRGVRGGEERRGVFRSGAAGLEWGRFDRLHPNPSRAMPNEPSRFSDDQAARIWRRAAELQAARRLPAPAEHEGEGERAGAEAGRLTPDEIVAIGAEAGIDPEFVAAALTEAEFAPPAAEGATGLGTRRRIDAPPEQAQAALQAVAERAPFALRLVDIRPAGEARVLVFDVAAEWGGTLNAGSLAAGPNVTALHALLRPGDQPGTTELVLHAPANPTLPRSVRRHDLGFGGFGGALGGLVGGGIAAELAVAGAMLVAPAVAGALAVGVVGVWGMRAAQRWARRKDAATLEKLADEVVGAVRIRRHAAPLLPGPEAREAPRE